MLALFGLSQHCDAFAAGGPATQTGGSVFGRDFQLATALVLEEFLTITIYVPADGRLYVLFCLDSLSHSVCTLQLCCDQAISKRAHPWHGRIRLQHECSR